MQAVSINRLVYVTDKPCFHVLAYLFVPIRFDSRRLVLIVVFVARHLRGGRLLVALT